MVTFVYLTYRYFFFLTLFIVASRYRAGNIQMNKIIDTFLLKTTIPVTRTYPEGARRTVPNPGMPYSQLATLAARSPHCFSVGNARARYSHTAPRRVVSRAFIIRALPPRGCRKHGRPCENPAGSGALPPMHDFRWSRTLHHRILVLCARRLVANTRKRKNEIRASKHSYSGRKKKS